MGSTCCFPVECIDGLSEASESQNNTRRVFARKGPWVSRVAVFCRENDFFCGGTRDANALEALVWFPWEIVAVCFLRQSCSVCSVVVGKYSDANGEECFFRVLQQGACPLFLSESSSCADEHFGLLAKLMGASL